MANLLNSMYFRFLLASIFIISVSAQCQPFNMVTTEVSSTQLSLSWRCYDPDTDDQLQVIYRLINRGQCDTGDGREDPPFDSQTTQWGTYGRNMFAANSYDQSATLFDLLPYSTYSVSVRARSPDGAGGYNPGNPVYIDPNPTTSEAAPSGSPTIELTAHAEYQTSLSFVWGEIPCEQRNGNIIYSYETRNRNNQLVSGVTYLPFRTVLVGVYNLPCGNTYKVRVVANQTTYSEYGTGTTCCSTRGAGAVVNLMPTYLTSTQRRYTWTAPTYSGCPSPSGTLQYDVSFVGVSRLTGCSLQNHQGAYTISDLYYDIYSLKPFYIYTFTVTAVGGTDSSDTWFTSQPAQRVYPSNIMLSASTTTSLTISWDEIPCNSRNGNIQEYPYELSSSNGVRIRADEVVMTSATITGLERDTTYAFRVAARTEDGIGTMSNKVNFQTMAISISAPTDITAVMILKTSLTFAWSAVTCTGACPGPITGYTWRLLLNNGIVDSGSTGANLMSAAVSGLMACTTYTFEVAGITVSETGSYGTKQQETAVDVPGIPLGLSVVYTLKDMIRIQWTLPASRCPVESYTVEYRLINRDQCQQITNEKRISHGPAAAGSSSLSTISDLLPYSTYEVFVYAVNSDGQGLEASVTAMTLEGDRPTAASANVIVTSTGRNSLSFSWGEVPCGNRHGVIQRYQYVLKTEESDSTIAGPSYTSDRMVTIMTVSPCTTYRFRVRASFSGNTGISYDWSEYIYAVTAGAVDTLSIVPQSSTELAVSWTVPSDSCTTSAEYTVESRLINQDQCLELDNSEVQYGIVSETSAALTNLRPYSTYEVSVKVESSVETQSATTEGSTPTSGPDNLTAVATNSSIIFTWSEPPCGQRNGIITGYTYSFIEGGSRAKRAVNVEDAATTEMMVTFTDLDIYTEHTFTIAANTDDGKGVETTMTYRTLAGVPSAPIEPKETTTTDSKPGIQWSAPDMPNGEIIEYIIRYWSSDDISDWLLTAAVEGKTLMYTFPDILKTNTAYNFQVRAKTSAGVGPWSDVITVFIAQITSSGTFNQPDKLGPIIGAVVAVILVGVVIIALICYYRRNKASTKETPKETVNDENEIYDEIDAKKEMMAKQQQRLQTLETGYEVNIAMETKMSPRAQSDGSAYEDVNIKEESEYQGLDLDTVNEEQSYQDLKGNTVGDKSAPQYANV